MVGAAVRPAEAAAAARAAALGFEAPYLIEKLVKDRICDSEAEARELFGEVKRFLYLNRADRSRIWEMYSHRIDEVWHQFVLFTRQYMDFCDCHFGVYLPHSPGNAPKPPPGDRPGAPPATFREFAARYEAMYGEPLPDCWHDENSVTLNRRVIDAEVGALLLRAQGDTVELVDGVGELVFAVNVIAAEAMAFIADTGAFYVRELPGDLTAEEKVALAATLVRHRLLRVAS